MTNGTTIIDNRKVSDLSEANQNRVYNFLKRMGLKATEFETLWQGYVVNLPDALKAKIGIDARAFKAELKMWK